MIRQLSKYAVVGGLNTAIDFALYALLVLGGVWYVAAKVMAWAVATVNGYVLNRRWTFEAGPFCRVGLAKYTAVQASGMAVNVGLLVALVELAGVGQLLAQVIAAPLAALVTFLANRHWTFRSPVPA